MVKRTGVEKSRLVVKDFNTGKRDGCSSPTPTAESVRCVEAKAVIDQLEGEVIDVTNAFPHADEPEVYYLDAPEEMQLASDEILQPVKALYGRRTASRNFFIWIRGIVILFHQSLKPIRGDCCVFYSPDLNLTMLVHVDDFYI